MKNWQKISGCVIFGLGAVIELLLWTFAITDWEDTPWYSCISSLSCAMWINYFVALGLFVYLWRKGDREKKSPKYSSSDGLRLDWVNGFEIKSNVSEDGMVIKANKEGLLSLANHLANLAQSDVPIGTHIHLDSLNSLEDGSDNIIIEKI
ncbi:hypothetical protein [uncultured Phocaeicola sp.]|uniref:Imm32 family immunity protein n=1 Tax=uncultured Phocaeicola sp. TaxID=990718 RepID=UPI0025A677B6|nr:hypothetical protein [uncultured Phocaeicola sp.]